MKYSQLSELYDALASTPKRLEKIDILSQFLLKIKKSGNSKWVYLIRGRVLPDYDAREFGISRQLIIKIISKSSGISSDKVVSEFNKIGDLGEVAKKFIEGKKQATLFSSKLSVDKVFDNLIKLFELGGKGSVDKKIGLVAEIGRASCRERV